MRQRISLDDRYDKAAGQARAAAADSGAVVGLWPSTCPFPLDDLVASRLDVVELVARLGEDQAGDPA